MDFFKWVSPHGEGVLPPRLPCKVCKYKPLIAEKKLASLAAVDLGIVESGQILTAIELAVRAISRHKFC